MAASNAQKTAALVKQGGLEEIKIGKHAEICFCFNFDFTKFIMFYLLLLQLIFCIVDGGI